MNNSIFKPILLLAILLILPGFLSAKSKYAIGMFHYNFQYVAGDYRIESRIVRESLYPALQFFEAHPTYKADFEFQGYAIETMAQEYPEALKLLKKLVSRGQIELVIAHYSDQFFIAYPAKDLRKSIEISDNILQKYGLKRSRVFFGQEIQYSPGLATALTGTHDVVVTSSDPHGYYRGATQPLVNIKYGQNQILGLIGAGEKHLKNLDWAWSFLDDGEVFNTLDYNSDFYRVPEQEQKSIDRYKQLEAEGYQFVTMSEFVEILKKDKDYKIEDYLFIPEGTWNMSVCGPFMWMGRQRSGVETDGITRALSYDLRGQILLAEKLIAYAKSRGMEVGELEKWVEQAWRHLLLSEVSDSSGWTPWLVEVQYTANEVANARGVLKKIFDALAANGIVDERLVVHTGNGVVSSDEIPDLKEKTSSLPIPIYIRAASYQTEVSQIGAGLYKVDIACARPDDGAVEIVFDTAEKGLCYSAGAGEETIVEIPTDLMHDPAMALSNGFIYLGNGYSLIKDCSAEHLAATWHQQSKKLVFREELNDQNPGMKMRFYIVKGEKEKAHDLANQLNTWPAYSVLKKGSSLAIDKVFPFSQ